MNLLKDELPVDWAKHLDHVVHSTAFNELSNWVEKEINTQTVFPSLLDVFAIYKLNALEKIKVVIIGQDPYHGENQANGMSFSVKKGVRHPPSLKNIFKELFTDLNLPVPHKFNGDLTSWANQGVFLLNAVLTVTKAQPNSHKNKGWETFTDATIKAISDKKEHVVFILWGKFAQQKSALIDDSKHFIISSPHPSPFSARKGFFGSRPFSRSNAYLSKNNLSPIHWEIKN